MSQQQAGEQQEAATSEGPPVCRQDSSTSLIRCLFPTSSEESQASQSTTDESQEAETTTAEDEDGEATSDAADVFSTPDAAPKNITSNNGRQHAATMDSDTTPADDGDLVDARDSDTTPADNGGLVDARDSDTTPADDGGLVHAVDSDTTPADDGGLVHAVDSDTTPADIGGPVDAADTSAEDQFDGDVNDNPDIMEHDEYKELVVAKSEGRHSLRSTNRPTLWRHQRKPMACLCVYDAIDDGICLAQVGILWSVDCTTYEIILVASLGWQEQRARRSHQISYNNPIYIILRSAHLHGSEIRFEQLIRVLATVLFREGRPHSTVHFPSLALSREMSEAFVDCYQRDIDKWCNIKYLRTRKEEQQIEVEKQKQALLLKKKEAAAKRKRVAQERSAEKKRQLAELKREQVRAKRVAAAASRKAKKVEEQRRGRQIQRQIKAQVLASLREVETTLTSKFAEDIARSRSEVEAELVARLQVCEDGLSARLQVCEDASEQTTNTTVSRSAFDKYKSTVDKRFKALSKKIKTKRSVSPSSAPATDLTTTDGEEGPAALPKRAKIMSFWPGTRDVQERPDTPTPMRAMDVQRPVAHHLGLQPLQRRPPTLQRHPPTPTLQPQPATPTLQQRTLQQRHPPPPTLQHHTPTPTPNNQWWSQMPCDYAQPAERQNHQSQTQFMSPVYGCRNFHR